MRDSIEPVESDFDQAQISNKRRTKTQRLPRFSWMSWAVQPHDLAV